MPKGGTDPCVYMERDIIVGTTDAQLVYGCGIGNCIAKNKDPGNYFRESKSLILCSKKLVLVQVKKWDESPKRPPPTRQMLVTTASLVGSKERIWLRRKSGNVLIMSASVFVRDFCRTEDRQLSALSILRLCPLIFI